MKKTLIAAVAALALPVSGAMAQDVPAPTPKEAAKAACKTLRASMDKKTFRATYGANAFGKCISAAAKLEKVNITDAKSDCKAEQAMTDEQFAEKYGEGTTFTTYYGTNKTGKNAYGKCVSGKAKTASKADVKATLNAAKTCKQLRSDNGEEWAKYGTAKNAFGKCVSEHAKAQREENEETTS